MAEDYSAMTTNERLFAAGLMGAFDEAVKSGELSKINEVLAQVGLHQERNGTIRSFANDA